jgi:hypothetical protein
LWNDDSGWPKHSIGAERGVPVIIDRRGVQYRLVVESAKPLQKSRFVPPK